MPFRDVKYLGRVWFARARVNLIREMEFRGNFLFGIVRQMLWLGSFLLMISVMFRNTDSLAGWSAPEVLIVLALSRLIEGIMNALFVQNIMTLPQSVQRGEFDFFLLKPLPVQLYTAFRDFSVNSLFNIFAGIVLLVYATSQLPYAVSLLDWGLFVAMVALGITIFYSLLILVASLVFRLERLEALWGFMTLFSEPLTVPFDIFPRPARIVLTYLLPIAFVVFFPAQALTSRLTWQHVLLAVGFTALFLVLANAAWLSGLRRYTSASS